MYSAIALGIVSVICSICLALAEKRGFDFFQLNDSFLLLANVFALLLSRYVMLTIRLTYKTKAYSVINIVQKILYIPCAGWSIIHRKHGADY